MARKWKQINRFVEIFAAALCRLGLGRQPTAHPCGGFRLRQGYLTLRCTTGCCATAPPRVTGLELRKDMVQLCNAVVADNALQGLRFDEGDLRSIAASQLDVMVALHACDIATDHAPTLRQAGAQILLSSPCCHSELRPDAAAPLRPMLKHGIHLARRPEMVPTHCALLLESQGYYDASVRVHRAGAHKQEQDDPGGEGPRGCGRGLWRRGG